MYRFEKKSVQIEKRHDRTHAPRKPPASAALGGFLANHAGDLERRAPIGRYAIACMSMYRRGRVQQRRAAQTWQPWLVWLAIETQGGVACPQPSRASARVPTTTPLPAEARQPAHHVNHGGEQQDYDVILPYAVILPHPILRRHAGIIGELDSEG